MTTVPAERVILLLLFALVIIGLIAYVFLLIVKEVSRRLDIWVIRRARYLENQQQHHHHHSQKPSSPRGGSVQRRRKKKGYPDSGGDDSYSDNENSGSYSD